MPTRIPEFLSQLRFPYLLLLTAAIFFLDVLVPDPVPFVDEILLGAVTLLLAKLKKKVRNAAGIADPPSKEPCIVDQDVDLAERFHAGFHQVETILSDGHVGPDHQRTPSPLPHLRSAPFRRLHVDVRHHHVRPVPSQGQADAGADPTPAAGGALQKSDD